MGNRAGQGGIQRAGHMFLLDRSPLLAQVNAVRLTCTHTRDLPFPFFVYPFVFFTFLVSHSTMPSRHKHFTVAIVFVFFSSYSFSLYTVLSVFFCHSSLLFEFIVFLYVASAV